MDINSRLFNTFPYPVNVCLHLANCYRDMTDSEMAGIISSLKEIDIIKDYSSRMSDIEESLNLALINDRLKPYRDLYNMRFREKLSLQEVANREGKSIERIRQKLAKMIRMLKGRTNVGMVIPAMCSKDPFKSAKWYIFMKYGELWYFDDLRPFIGNKIGSSPSSVDRFDGLVERDPYLLEIGKNGVSIYVESLQKDNTRLKEENIRLKDRMGILQPTDVPDVLIEDLDLSVRTYNCLKRAGLNTLGAITDRSKEGIMRIRNWVREVTMNSLRNLRNMA